MVLWTRSANAQKCADTPRKRSHDFAQCSAGLTAIVQSLCTWRGLQAAVWFVTTVKQGTALEALARRRSRLDISEIQITCRTFACEDNSRRTFWFDSNLQADQRRQRGCENCWRRVAQSSKVWYNWKVDEPPRRDREAAIQCELQNSSGFDRIEQVAGAMQIATLVDGLAKS